MKDILKIALAAAIAAVIVDIARRLGVRQWGAKEVPTLRPVEDALPEVEEPLGEEELRVAQNAPF